MSTKLTTKQETKTALLEVGMDMMMEKGYSNTGIQEILTALSVPKGSFYHYFDSKENYTVEVIRHYDQTYAATLLRTLRNPKQSPLQRLKAYCDQGKAKLAAQQCRKGCLIGNLSQEMSDQSEVLRKELSAIFDKQRNLFAECIKEGQDAGEITKKWTAVKLADLFLSGWSGAMMRAKTVKNTEPLDIFIDLILKGMFKA